MISTIIVVVLAFALLLFSIRLAKGHGYSPQMVENPAEHLRSVDVEAFRNLINPEEEEFLRRRLRPEDFRRIQRERLRAAVEYISGAAGNASVLLQVGEAARRNPDPVVAAAAEKLVDNAIRLRIYAFQAIPRLYLGIIFPAWRTPSLRVPDSYEQMTRQVVRLGLQYPIRGVSAAL